MPVSTEIRWKDPKWAGGLEVICIEIGFSVDATTALYRLSDDKGAIHSFGEGITVLGRWIKVALDDRGLLLIVEAPLSHRYSKGNPAIRFEKESGRGWWYGAGAIVSLAAGEMFRRLGPVARRSPSTLYIAEAFLSKKPSKKSLQEEYGKDRLSRLHLIEASLIARKFFSGGPPETFLADVESRIPEIASPAPVRSYSWKEVKPLLDKAGTPSTE